ncbi:hypothetical protein [Desulfurobacterium crinifex]
MHATERIAKMTAQRAEEHFWNLLNHHTTHRQAFLRNGLDGLYALGDETAHQLIELAEAAELEV